MIASFPELLGPVTSGSTDGKNVGIPIEKHADFLSKKDNPNEQTFLKLLDQMPKKSENPKQPVINHFGFITRRQFSEKESHDLFASKIEPKNFLNDSKNESTDSKNIESNWPFIAPIEDDEKEKAGLQNILSVLEQIMHPKQKKQPLSTEIYSGALFTDNKPAAENGMVSIGLLINSDSEESPLKNETILENTPDNRVGHNQKTVLKNTHLMPESANQKLAAVNIQEGIDYSTTSNKYSETVFDKNSKQVINNVLNQVADHLFKDARQGLQNTTIHSFPRELGPIGVEIFSNDNGPTVHMTPKNPDVAEILEKHFQPLKQASVTHETAFSALKVSNSPHAALNTGLNVSETKPTDKQLKSKNFAQQAKTEDGLKMVTNMEEKIQKIEEILKSSTIKHSDTDNPVRSQPMKNPFSQTQTKLDVHDSRINLNTHLKQTDTVIDKNFQRVESNVLNQIAARLFNGVRQNTPNMTIHLYPPELGKVRVKIISKKGGLNVQLQSPNNQVVGILERNLPILQQSLEDQGITLSELRVNVESDSQDHEKSRFEKEEFAFADENIIQKKLSQEEQGVSLTETNHESSELAQGLSLRV